MSTRVTIQGRLAFPRLDKPERFQGTGEPRYSANIIIEPDSVSFKKTLLAMRAAAAAAWGEAKADAALKSLRTNLKTALMDGTGSEYDGYDGNFIVRAHAKANQPPVLVASQGGVNITLDRETQSIIYGGCYVNAIIDWWGQDNKWGKRINAQLCGVQFVRDGDPFAGGKPASTDDFEVIEESEEDLDDVSF